MTTSSHTTHCTQQRNRKKKAPKTKERKKRTEEKKAPAQRIKAKRQAQDIQKSSQNVTQHENEWKCDGISEKKK